MTKAEYIEKFRNFLKDHEYLNRLLNFEQENEDSYLELYLDMAVAFLSSMPPFVYRPSLDDPNFPFFSLIIHQSAIEALISNSIVQARNDLTYNNGGISVKVDDANRYMGLLQALYKLADREIAMYQKWLIAININNGYGGVGSPYNNIGGSGSTTPYGLI
jgi:hypothetical protein